MLHSEFVRHPEFSFLSHKQTIGKVAGHLGVHMEYCVLYNTLLNNCDVIGNLQPREIKQKFPFLRWCNETVQIVLSNARSISLFSII